MSFTTNKHKFIFGLAGFSNSGKTTISISLIKIFKERGFSIGTIKHAHHDFEIDKPGKDSWRHREAGSQEIIVSSSKRIAHIIEHENYNEITFIKAGSLDQPALTDITPDIEVFTESKVAWANCGNLSGSFSKNPE